MEKIRQKALQFFHEAEMAERWLHAPVKSLAGKTPLEYADNEQHCQDVLDYLDQFIDHNKAS